MNDNAPKGKPPKAAAFETIAASGLNPHARLVAYAILGHVRAPSLSWVMSRKKIVADTGLSLASVKRGIADLKRAGLLDVIERRGPDGRQGWSRYRLKISEPATAAQISDNEPPYCTPTRTTEVLGKGRTTDSGRCSYAGARA